MLHSNNVVFEVALAVPLFWTFHYFVPQENVVHTGSRVYVEFRHRKTEGFVVGFPSQAYEKTKPILSILNDEPFFSVRMLEFFKWISFHYGTPLGEVIKAALPLIKGKALKSEALKGKVPKIKIPFSNFSPTLSPKNIILSQEQKNVLSPLIKCLQDQLYKAFLLHGVTGSGKTEIYLRLIEKSLLENRPAIVLVPEISLTPQLLSRFEERFPGKIARLHSQLTPAQRHQEWLSIKNQKKSIAIGARSAIFAPFQNLGVIIVDEEHDASFKQEERFRYNAKDLALVRGQLENAVVVLGSATPSLETYYNSQIGKVTYLALKERIDGKPLPKVEIIDLTENVNVFGDTHLFSEPLRQGLAENLQTKQQSMLLLNRRGYSPFLLCQECGHVEKCPHCSVSLTVYLSSKNLICHYCSYALRYPESCKSCHGKKLSPLGVGTEKVEEELKRLFPEARIARLDRSATRKRNVLEQTLAEFAHQKIDILIGTQMIAKGHDFPNVTLVGVILADVAFHLPDFRAPERAFQLLTQVAGRSGRGAHLGRVMIQTFQPQHYSTLFAKEHDYEGFYKTELEIRRELFYPPFSKLVHFKISDENAKKALDKMKILAAVCKKITEEDKALAYLQFLGPSVAPMAKINNKFRFHLLMKSPSHQLTRKFLTHLFKQNILLSRRPAIHVDVDPLNLL